MAKLSPVTIETSDARSFPNDRAFVVPPTAGSDVTRRALFGRVEHVLSAHAARFQTRDRRLDVSARVLSENATANPVPFDEERERSAQASDR